MQHQEEFIVEFEDQALADAARATHNAAMQGFERGLDRSQDERVSESDLTKRLADHACIQRIEVDDQIGQFWHRNIVACLVQLITRRVNRTIAGAGSSKTVCA